MLEIKQSIVRLPDRNLPIPYWELDSGKSGPVLLVTAAIHGGEVQGAEAIRRVLPVFSADLMRGTVLLCPFVNPLAVRARKQHLNSQPGLAEFTPGMGNLNHTWPGKVDGDVLERIAFAINRDLVGRATHLVDIHAWPRPRASTVVFRLGDKSCEVLARHSAFRFAQGRAYVPPKSPGGGTTLTGMVVDSGRAAICLEPSGQYGFPLSEVQRTMRAILNIAKLLDLLPGEPEGMDEPFVWTAGAQSFRVTSPKNGLFAPENFKPSDHVEADQLLGHLIVDDSLEILEVRAPEAGYLWNFGRFQNGYGASLTAQHPYAEEGEDLAVILQSGPDPLERS